DRTVAGAKLDAERGAEALPEPAAGAEEAARLRPRQMLLQHAGMGDRLFDINRVLRHRLTQGADKRQRVDSVTVLRLGLGGALCADHLVVLALPSGAPVGVLAGANAFRLCGLDQKTQRGRDLAFEIVVGLQALIDHHALEWVLVDRNDSSVGRLA